MASCRIERDEFYPGLGLEPGPLALHASALTTTEFVDPEVRKHGSNRLILSWIGTCPGQRSGKRKVQVPVQDRIFLFQFYN